MYRYLTILLFCIVPLISSYDAYSQDVSQTTTQITNLTATSRPKILYNSGGNASNGSQDISGNATSLNAVSVVSPSFLIHLNTQNETVGNRNVTAVCWYPVSGIYGTLARALFYATFYFALVLYVCCSNSRWLVIGALASAMTFAATAAVHMLIMVWSGYYLANTDFFAIHGILMFSVSIATPLLIWSRPIQKLASDAVEDISTRTVILFWCVLIFVATFSQAAEIWRHRNDQYQNVAALTASTSVVCNPVNGVLDLGANQSMLWNETYINADFVDTNSCGNPCGQLEEYTITRNFGQLQPLTRVQIDHFIQLQSLRRPESVVAYRDYSLYLNLGAAILFWVIAYGLIAVVVGRRTPSQMRNRTFKLFRPKNRFYSFFVKILACLFQLIAMFGLLPVTVSFLCSVIFIVGTEYAMYEIPQADNLTQIDAWAPWCTAGLVLFVAFLYRVMGQLTSLAAWALLVLESCQPRNQRPLEQPRSSSNCRDNISSAISSNTARSLSPTSPALEANVRSPQAEKKTLKSLFASVVEAFLECLAQRVAKMKRLKERITGRDRREKRLANSDTGSDAESSMESDTKHGTKHDRQSDASSDRMSGPTSDLKLVIARQENSRPDPGYRLGHRLIADFDAVQDFWKDFKSFWNHPEEKEDIGSWVTSLGPRVEDQSCNCPENMTKEELVAHVLHRYPDRNKGLVDGQFVIWNEIVRQIKRIIHEMIQNKEDQQGRERTEIETKANNERHFKNGKKSGSGETIRGRRGSKEEVTQAEERGQKEEMKRRTI